MSRALIVALVVLGLAVPASAQSRLTKVLRVGALGAISLNTATVLYPQKRDVRASLVSGALWGATWVNEKDHPIHANIIYVAMIAANSIGAGYKIHARWGTRQF